MMAGATQRVIRVLIVEDSAVTREFLLHLLSRDRVFQVVGMARNGLEGVEQAERLRPDVILMDVYMPRMNGYEATRQIMERVPSPIVMVSANFNRDEVAMTFEALKAGALAVVEKPGGPDHPKHGETTRLLLQTVRLMAEVKVIRRWPKHKHPVPPTPVPAKSDQRIRLVAIGASTGGPGVVAEILAGLPAAPPILLVQHIAPGFTTGLAEWLNRGTRLEVKPAKSGEAVRPGTVYLAPEGLQMGITKDARIRLTREPAEDGFCPSVTHLFHSVAESYGRSAIGILLTGMGRDGASGLQRLRDAGGVTMVQDEESSVVFGMPAEAIRLGAAEYVLSPEQISGTIRSLVTQGKS